MSEGVREPSPDSLSKSLLVAHRKNPVLPELKFIEGRGFLSPIYMPKSLINLSSRSGTKLDTNNKTVSSIKTAVNVQAIQL
jgi:hypothetical protein